MSLTQKAEAVSIKSRINFYPGTFKTGVSDQNVRSANQGASRYPHQERKTCYGEVQHASWTPLSELSWTWLQVSNVCPYTCMLVIQRVLPFSCWNPPVLIHNSAQDRFRARVSLLGCISGWIGQYHKACIEPAGSEIAMLYIHGVQSEMIRFNIWGSSTYTTGHS